MYFPGLAGPSALIAFFAFMLLLVPWQRIRKLLPVGIIFGLLLGTATYYILQNVVEAWRFQNVDLFTPAGVPLFMTLAWIPYTVIYFHLLAQYRSYPHTALLLLVAAAVPAFFHFMLEINGMVAAAAWPWWGNFFYAAVVYNTGALLVYHRFGLHADTKVR